MAFNTLLFMSGLVAALAVPAAEAQLGLVSGLLGLIRVQGTVFCTANGNMGVNGTSTPVFPNASVQLRCGIGNIAATATTNALGTFSIVLDSLSYLLSSVLSNCSVVVNTPLANCNAALPSAGTLSSPLQYIGNTLLGLLNVANIIPGGFNLLP
ncbi:putative Pollen Ole e 1 allergen and extensin family protein [Tripterygium wilfordii]|uniref:Putative Pollen Ole e 1 allergen and extensin family protein n=1 Tax=Tripterygium wilfordii TaxID=458696 RepID=A0A7J7CSD7_TRIWF|nr:phylloplanin-like [Tripterygium wilfordii]KAF5737000.1 putative Pollen Ole e 1 allergen and extensin family protein [Tripterygium wilfordii]